MVLAALSSCSGCWRQVRREADGHGIDNCTTAPNPTQLDADHDGYGSACGSDFNEDDVLNFVDLAILRSFFFMPPWPSDVERATRVPFVSKEERLAFIERAVRGEEQPITEGDC